MFIQWIGRVPRTNSFGTFKPNKTYDVPDHIAKELLQVKYFVVSDEEGNVAVENLAQTNPYVESLLTKIEKLEQEIQQLRIGGVADRDVTDTEIDRLQTEGVVDVTAGEIV